MPPVGGDTLWASGYSAYEKLSPDFRKLIDAKQAVYRSAHPYLDRENPNAGPQYIERTHPLVRVHPATGWKALWVNRAMTSRIVGLDKAESDLILGYLYDVYEKNVDIQVRFKWTPRTSALWDNRYNRDLEAAVYLLTCAESQSTMRVGIMVETTPVMGQESLHWRRFHTLRQVHPQEEKPSDCWTAMRNQ